MAPLLNWQKQTDRNLGMSREQSSDEMVTGINLGLARISALLKSLGNPHLSVPIIHVAGTNGKGSVCAYLDSILRTSGLRVGRFTSPHLVRVRDCVTIQGKTIDLHNFVRAKQEVDDADKRAGIGASSFELLTAAAFEAFRGVEPPLDVAVVEVGMGGETDATNVCPTPLVTAITAIDLDHQALLGNTVSEIAKVKAGIIKQGVPCVLAPQAHQEASEVVGTIAGEHESKLYVVQTGKAEQRDASTLHLLEKEIVVRLPLPGAYQLANAGTAALAIDVLRTSTAMKISDADIIAGIELTRWPGRLDWLEIDGRKVLLDGAHNTASMVALREYLETLPTEPTTFILALSAPREPASLLRPLLANSTFPADIIATDFSLPEGMPWVKPVSACKLASAASEVGVKARTASNVREALEMATASERTVICGSLYLVADVYRFLESR